MMKMLYRLSVLSCCQITEQTPAHGEDNLAVYKCSWSGVARNVSLCVYR